MPLVEVFPLGPRVLSIQRSAARPLPGHPCARGLAVSKAHRPRKKKVDVEFASLFRRFVHEYGDSYVQLAEQLETHYPEITRRGRRTGRALRNICFIVWCSFRDGDRKLIPTLFRAAVLLSAQDDFYDNPRIAAEQKEAFRSEINHALRARSFGRHRERSRQLRDLTSLWSYVARTIPRSEPQVRSYWIETACQLNDAMAAENRSMRSATIAYEEYMRTAIHSIGMVFIWATYVAHEHLPVTTLREMAPVLVQGASVVRLSNDMASYRQRKNRLNALNLMRGNHRETRVRQLVMRKARAFRQSVEALEVAPRVRDVLLHSMDFLREFYQRSDFHRGPVW